MRSAVLAIPTMAESQVPTFGSPDTRKAKAEVAKTALAASGGRIVACLACEAT